MGRIRKGVRSRFYVGQFCAEKPEQVVNGEIWRVNILLGKGCTIILGCPLRGACHKAKTSRIIQVNHKLNQYKAQARDKLNSEEGIEKRKRRCADVESTFGILKHNHDFKRFLLRGNKKVEIETGIHALAHNLRKYCAILTQKHPKQPLFPVLVK